MPESQVTREYVLEAIQGTSEPYEDAKRRLEIEEAEEWARQEEQARLETADGAFQAWWEDLRNSKRVRMTMEDAKEIFTAGFEAAAKLIA